MNLITGQVPIRDPLGLRNEVITNPQWIKWLTEQLAPAILAIAELGLSPDNLLLYRQVPGVAQAQESAESAAISAAAKFRRYTNDDGFVAPPFTPSRAEQCSFEIPISWARPQPEYAGMPPASTPASPVWLLSDLHANKAKYPAGSYAAETAFFETDRVVLYRSSGVDWVYAAGTYIDVAANRPADLGANDVNFQFLASDTLEQSYWDGAAWVVYGADTAVTGTWTPTVIIGGSSVGVTYGSQVGKYFQVGTLIIATFDITLTSIAALVGDVEIGGLPVNLTTLEVTGGSIQYCENMLLLSSLPSVWPEIGTPRVALYNTTAAGSTALTQANFTNTTRIVGTAIYAT